METSNNDAKHTKIQELITSALNTGFITGSTVFGGATKQSDLDIVLPPTFSKESLTEYEEVGSVSNEKDGNTFTSVYLVDDDGKRYNFILTHDEGTYKEYMYATTQIFVLKELHGIDFSEKARRINVFQTLRLLHRYGITLNTRGL